MIQELRREHDLTILLEIAQLPKATFYDNDNGFVTVAKYKNGELQTIGQNSPKWLLELIEKMK